MVRQFKLGDVTVDVVLKDIKNVHLSVHPPTGRVRIAAPSRMRQDTIRAFCVGKLSWIRQQQRKLREQDRETAREYLDRESHYVFGKRCMLTVIEADAAPSVELKHRNLILKVRPGTSKEVKRAFLDDWYRRLLKQTISPLIARGEQLTGVKVTQFFVQRMKTKWGSCNHRAGTIRLNTELAKKPRECLEYIVIHEMVHVLEPTHNARFIALMDRFMPRWQFYRKILNSLPLRQERWNY
jgi:predicted metal-dependent hydrolase